MIQLRRHHTSKVSPKEPILKQEFISIWMLEIHLAHKSLGDHHLPLLIFFEKLCCFLGCTTRTHLGQLLHTLNVDLINALLLLVLNSQFNQIRYYLQFCHLPATFNAIYTVEASNLADQIPE